ncbi:MAG: hypothetical protein B7Z55_05530 [Planctomycetales bacterium 12-60-4]|nr:MAG: hypothetical protein B7Z55_05530 [Planctomycetales bacterium 12-60-4]
MRRSLLFVGSLVMIATSVIWSQVNMAADTEPKLLRHMVLFKMKADATPEQVQELVDAFAALPVKISEIHAFEHGGDVSVENLADGFTHGFLVTFKTAKDRDAYLPNPEHQKFVQLAKQRVDKALVFDYWAVR